MPRFTIAAWLLATFAFFRAFAAADELRIVGTGDGLQLLRDLASAYSSQSGSNVNVPDSIGSGGGIAAVSAGEERLARVARVLKESERSAGLLYVPFARIPAVFFVHESAGVTELTSDQVKAIFQGEIRSWADVGGRDIRIRVVRREDGDSTLQVLRASMPGWSDLKFTDRSKMAVTTQDAVETVRMVEGAIGFAPRSEAIVGNTVILSIDGKKPTDPEYPSAVELAFVFKSGMAEPDMQAFFDFVRSEKGREILVAQGGLPLS